MLHYTANASVGGKLAQVGSRLVDMAAQKMAGEFFEAFNASCSSATRRRRPRCRAGAGARCRRGAGAAPVGRLHRVAEAAARRGRLTG